MRSGSGLQPSCAMLLGRLDRWVKESVPQLVRKDALEYVIRGHLFVL